MKERPILFSAPMVRAILDGSKTQTRRAVKGISLKWLDEGFTPDFVADYQNGLCPYGQPGDRLWVRETFKPITSGEIKNGYGELRYGFAYQADGHTQWNDKPTIIHDLTGQPATGPMQFQPVPWKPSIHMPRRASRITLEITGVRVERLNEIHEQDAIAEGAPCKMFDADTSDLPEGCAIVSESHRAGFIDLWESINGAGSWAANPWVWVVEFNRVQQP